MQTLVRIHGLNAVKTLPVLRLPQTLSPAALPKCGQLCFVRS